MRVGWLADEHDPPGGAELTQAEFQAAAPEGVEIVDFAPGKQLDQGIDRWVVHNCRTYSEMPHWGRVFRYLHDMRGDYEHDQDLICCSPLQAEALGLHNAWVPPPIDLSAFRPTRQQRRNDERKGTCCVGAFMNPGKGGHLVAEWAAKNEPVDVWGFGPYMPRGDYIADCGDVDPVKLPQLLWNYERFVFLPTALEPFGRCVVEAWAAGCEIITNNLVGARYWIEEAPEKLETASEDFWTLVLGAGS
jgi:glycosyltransferase involved in cell wall biosynthesis